MFGLYISLAFLGLSAVDPIGIGVMPAILVLKYPYKRVTVFMSGSFISLMVMGLFLAKGLGQIFLKFEHNNSWFVPVAETVAGAILLIIAAVIYIRERAGKTSFEHPIERLNGSNLGDGGYFGWVL